MSSFLPPVVMEMRANASQFLSEQGKVIASAKATATETEKAAQKEAAAARTSAAEATRAAEQKTAAADTSAKAAVVAADKRVAAEAKATEAQAKAAQMQTESLGAMTKEQQAAYDKQVAAAERAANAVDLASAKEVEAQKKAAAAATAAADAQKVAADAQVVAAEKTAAAQEVAATRSKVAMSSVVGVANKISAASILAGGAVAIASTEMAAHFEKSTMLLVTAGGESMGALAGVRQGILDISTQTGTSAEQMSEGMYIMEKAGFRGAAGLAALKASAQGAKDENVDLATMSQAVTDVLLDYNYKMDNATSATDSSVRVTNMLVAASGAAKTTMTDFAGSMSAIVPIASTAKISFAEVGGAIATMTQHGQTAQQSSQNLANLVMSLIRPNNLASAAMSQLGIDTTDLAAHLGERGLSGTLKIVNDAIKSHMTPDLIVHTGTMKDNANAAKAMDTIMSQMSPTMAKMSKGLQDGSVTQKEYTKAVKDMGGEAGALGNQFNTLYKANSGVTDSLKAGKPSVETYNAALRDVLGNVTAMRAAQMLLMNNGREFEANIKAIGDAGNKTGKDISTWADMQSTLSVQMDQSKQMVENLGIELGSKLIPAAKGALSGFTDLVHGFEQGNPVLMGIATVIGGAILISTVNLTQKMVLMGVAGVTNFINMGKSVGTMASQFSAGFGSASAAASTFTGKAGTLGGVVRGLGPAMTGAAVGAAALSAALMIVASGSDIVTVDAGKMATALSVFGTGTDTAKAGMDNMFSHWSSQWGMATSDIHDVNGAVDKLLHEDVQDQMSKWGDGIRDMFHIAHGEASQNEAAFKTMGDELGKLAGTNITKAQSAFQQLALKTDGSKESLTKLLDAMPGYKNALEDQVHAAGKDISQQEMLEYAYGKIPKAMQDAAKSTGGFTDAIGQVHPITPELQKSLDDAGVSADGLATDLGKVLDGMLATGIKTMSTREAISGYNKSIRDADATVKDMVKSGTDMSNALTANGADFNLADEAGSKLNSTLDDQIKKGLDLAKSMAGPGVDAHKAVQEQITKTYDDAIKQADAMIKAAGGTDVNGQAAIDLTRNLLNIPKDVDVKTWVDTEAAKQAVAKLQGSLDNLPTYKSISVDVKYTASGTQVLNNASDAGNTNTVKIGSYSGGAVADTMAGMYSGGLLGFDGGGLIPGTPPSRPNIDNILATVNGKPLKVRSGEFITNEPMTKVNLPYLKASNAGLNLGDAMASRYATGFVQGAQSAPQYATAGSGQHITNNVSVNTGASPDDIARAISWEMRTK